PGNANEQLLCTLFSELLGIPTVGVDDSFFALGGDSITAIRLVSKARAQSLQFAVRDVFAHPTPGALAQHAHTIEHVAQHIFVEDGVVPALPVYHQFLQLSGSLRRFHQATVLQAPKHVDAHQVQAALRKLMAHHGALRLRTQGNGTATTFTVESAQTLPPLQLPTLDLQHLDLVEQENAIAGAMENLSDCLEPDTSGGMVAPLWVERGPKQACLLLLAIHHFAIDGVSWRILLEDLDTLSQNIDAVLPERTMSLHDWAHQLASEGRLGKRRSEEALWLAQLTPGVTLPQEHQITGAQNTLANSARISGTLDPDATEQLLRAPSIYHGQINDLLLSALGLALRAWSKTYYQQELGNPLVTLEGHGRETDADLTRTIGWFTSVFPVSLPLADLDYRDSEQAGKAIGQVKERLRSLPDKGLGYGVLRYLDPASTLAHDTQHREPAISFNYLGRFEYRKDHPQSWQLHESGLSASGDDLERQRLHLIDINAVVTAQGCFHFDVDYCKLTHSAPAIAALAQHFEAALLALTKHCLHAPLANRYTPSDFALAQQALLTQDASAPLTQELLDHIITQAPQLTDLVPLTPLQQGLAFETLILSKEHVDPYHVQFVLILQRPVDIDALERAWALLCARHAILRLVLVPHKLTAGLGVIQAPDFYDWENVVIEGDPQERIDTLRAQDRARGFDLEQGPLIRARCAPLDDKRYALLISNHHLNLDGWSMPILLQELALLYSAEHQGKAAALDKPFAWQVHLAWLAQQDRASARTYWQEHLAGMSVTPLELAPPSVMQEGIGEVWHTVHTSGTTKLEQFARQQGLTPASVLQGLYILLLTRMSRLPELTIGSVRNGRNSMLNGIDRAIGLFIGTLPLRTEIKPTLPLNQWLRAQQIAQAEQEAHAHLGLMAISQLANLGNQDLFEALFVYENYPVGANAQTFADLGVESIEGYDSTHYRIALAAIPGDSLRLRLNFDRHSMDAQQAHDFLERLEQLLNQLPDLADTPLAQVPLLSTAERTRILEASAGKALTLAPEQLTLPEL
uniref:condensation domain-containing protein n=1 Tax=Polynucleobacter yangtzensis TaxID=1743159 RepID=UPI000B1DAEB2